MSVYMQFAPFELKNGDWDTQRDALGDVVVKTLAEYAPNLPSLIEHRQVITPKDLKQTYGLTGGHIFHGELSLDQLFTMRPMLEWSRYRTPINGLYLWIRNPSRSRAHRRIGRKRRPRDTERPSLNTPRRIASKSLLRQCQSSRLESEFAEAPAAVSHPLRHLQYGRGRPKRPRGNTARGTRSSGALLNADGQAVSEVNQFQKNISVRNGTATLHDLGFGSYQLILNARGFAPWSRVVEVRSNLPVNVAVKMSLAAIASNVEVNASTTLIDPNSSAVSYSVDSRWINESRRRSRDAPFRRL